MCKFCDNNMRSMNYRIPVRSSYSDDNLCEKIMDDVCDDCYGCMDENNHFTLYNHVDGLQVGFYHKIGDVLISRYSEFFYINYCPWCGRKISDGSWTFDKCCVDELTEVER